MLYGMRFYHQRCKKYDRGSTPCGKCNLGQHAHCRPRMDNTLCSCTCAKAAEVRGEVEALVLRYEISGELAPSVHEMVRGLGLRKYTLPTHGDKDHEYFDENLVSTTPTR